MIQDNPVELVLSQRRDLLEQPLEFYEPNVLPATQPIVSRHYRKPSGLVFFCFTDMSAPRCKLQRLRVSGERKSRGNQLTQLK